MKSVLHFGVGNFHRAHQAWYTAGAPGDWTITGVSLRSPHLRDQLKKQAWRYTLAMKDRDSVRYESMSVVRDLLVAPERPEAVLAAVASPETSAITVTVTEKGYALDAEGALDVAHPAIQHDLEHATPRSLIGYLARGLLQRAASGAPPVSVFSCDNLPANGELLKAAVERFVEIARLDVELERIAAFPSSMVDRITPATTPELVDECAAATGFHDQVPVETEAFSEWVIERNTLGDVPDWSAVGARWVADIAPFEQRKLRLLNGTHTLIAHLGRWRGHEYVHEAIADPVVLNAVEALMAEATSTLDAAALSGVGAYCDALEVRYANPALKHALTQIAVDSSIKLGVRIVPVLQARAARGESSPACCAVLAAWVAQTVLDVSRGTAVPDPANRRIEAELVACALDRKRVAALLRCVSPVLVTGRLVEDVLAAWPQRPEHREG